MNKKFSTLMLGLLLTSAFASAQTPVSINGVSTNAKQLDNPATDKTWAAGPYFIVADVDGSGTATENDILLVANKNGNTLSYQGIKLAANNTLDLASASWYFNEEVVKNAVTGVASEYYYSLKNAGTAAYLTVNASGTVISDSKASSHDASKGQYAKFSKSSTVTPRQFNQKDELYINLKSSQNAFILTNGAITSIAGTTTASKIILCNLETKTLTPTEVAELNDVKGGEGFNLAFDAKESKPWANDKLTDVNLKAFTVNSPISWGITDMSIPAGVYFVTSYPASLSGESVIETKEQFDACTFIAINPAANYDINEALRKEGIGFELMTVSGADMNFYQGTNKDQLSTGNEVYVGNACFAVEIPSMMTNPDAFNIKVKKYRAQMTAGKTSHTAKTNLYVGDILDQNENYMVTTTSDDALVFTTTNSTLYDVTKLLKSEDAPSIYTFQFVSDTYKNEKDNNFAGEKGQYLTVGRHGYPTTADLELSAVEDINPEDPMFQFVITAVDKTNKVATFANRQTKKTFNASFYENADGSYTVYSAEPLHISKFDVDELNGGVIFDDQSLQNTKVVLTPITVEDKFATFVNRADDAGLVTFELAKNADDVPAYYVGAYRNSEDDIVDDSELFAYADEAYQTQFELKKVTSNSDLLPLGGERDKEYLSITNSYVYKNGSRILTSTVKDTVAYAVYQVKAFTSEGDNYVYYDNYYGFYGLGDYYAPKKFAIKENVDGSVSLFEPSTAAVENAFNTCVVVDDNLSYTKNPAWKTGYIYDLESKLSEGLKIFMVEESPAISYEAVPQHVSFEAVRGGFMTKDDNSDARLSISTQAAEDLTFWLDTVDSDQNIPSFYILKNGAFMYNAKDSMRVYQDRKNYRFNIEEKTGIAKLIFKEGVLVSSDTLRTVVDGQSVLVAEKDNAPKKIKGGLKNFQFQIIKAEEDGDEYVIRQVNNGYSYVGLLNNYFFITSDKDAAYRFIIEKQSAPTANEGIEVSEVKVIAGNGQITIMGAAGKKVVVSNILGKVVASQTITSDNATIAVPAGIIAVAVEGEAAVKAIVK